jgi:hypothetical protein
LRRTHKLRRVSLAKLALPAAIKFVTFGDFKDLSF